MFFYIIERIQSKNDTINHTHDAILGKQCQIMSLEVGQRGWLLVDVGDKTFGPHRIALSNTLRISDDPDICIETEKPDMKSTSERNSMSTRNTYSI